MSEERLFEHQKLALKSHHAIHVLARRRAQLLYSTDHLREQAR